MRKLAFLLILLGCAVNVHAVNTLRIINDVPASVANPTNIFIQLNYTSASIGPALEQFEVVYPFTDAITVYTLMITNINGANLKYGIDPVHAMEQYSKVSDPDVHLMYDGLFEFSLLATDSVGYWDISNVDWIGMPCSVSCTSGGTPDATWQLKYYKTMAELIGMITNAYQFTSAQSEQVLVHSNVWASSWTKMMAPNHEVDAYVDSPGGKTHLVDYLYRLESNSVPMCLKANIPSADTNHFTGANPVGWQARVAALGTTPASFTGKFQWKSAVTVTPPIPGPGLTDEIVLVLSNATCGVVLYYSTDGINPGTTYRNDSDGGLWALYCTDLNAGTWEWVMTNRHLNCVTAGDPSLFEDWVASLANKVCYSLNAGLIPTNSNPTSVYTFSGYDNLLPTETNTWEYPPYEVNLYNNVIVNNSDSYGMGYSDANPFGAKKVVQQTEKDGAIVELHLLNPSNDPTPSDAILPVVGDFDGDGKHDPAIYQESSGRWILLLSAASYTRVDLAAGYLGGAGYLSVTADYDGDGKADPAVYQQSTGNWLVKLSTCGYGIATISGFGGSEYTQLIADFDGDGKADPAVVQNTAGNWMVKLSGNSYQIATLSAFGGAGYTPLAADYDADGKADPAIYQVSTGNWAIKLSASAYGTATLSGFGGTNYAAFTADFDADGKADPAVQDPTAGTWLIKLSASNYAIATLSNFGGAGYGNAFAADYDGDGKADPGLYQSATGTWYFRLSTCGYGQATASSGYPSLR